MMVKTRNSDVSKDDFENLHKDIDHISVDINNLKTKINDVVNSKLGLLVFLKNISLHRIRNFRKNYYHFCKSNKYSSFYFRKIIKTMCTFSRAN